MKALIARYRGHRGPLLWERRVELLVLGLVIALAVQLAWGGYGLLFPTVPEALSPASDSLVVGDIEGTQAVSEAERAEILTRPLFWETRRPVASAPEPEVQVVKRHKEPEKIKGVTLTGVFGSGDSAGIILVAGGQESRIVVGEELKGWRLDSVSATGAVFKSGKNTTELQLRQQKLALDIAGQEDAEQDGVWQAEAKQTGAKKAGKKQAGAKPAHKKKKREGNRKAKKRQQSGDKAEKKQEQYSAPTGGGLSLGGGAR